MNKQGMRYLSMGFFISAVILSGYQLMDSTEAAPSVLYTSEEAHTYDTSSDMEEIVQDSTDSTDSLDSTEETSTVDEEEETEQPEETKEEDLSEETNETEQEPSVVTIVIKEGQPSSILAKQLESEGLIENALDFDTYLEKQNAATKIRPGSYEIDSDMNFDQIINVLLKR